MRKSSRCLFDSDLKTFIEKEQKTIFGELCDKYHGDALTTTREAWLKEIEILQKVLIHGKNLMDVLSLNTIFHV